MQPLAQLSRELTDLESGREIEEYLHNKYSVKGLVPVSSEITCFDTFDWRLYRQRRLCYLQDNTLYLTDFTDTLLTEPILINDSPPFFWWQFPESGFKQMLAEIIDVRALLAQSSYSQKTRELHILNRDKKAVATVLLTETDPGNSTLLRAAHLREVRGYNKWFLKLSRDLERFGAPQPDTRVFTLKTVMASAGRRPMEYGSGFFVPLDADLDSLTAVKRIYANLLDTMLANEQGLIEDLDSEFLHDFRVAVRRTRSGIALIKGVLEPEISDLFKNEFRYLGRITGPLRDLDVYLLMKNNYKARLPQHLQEGLDYFFEDLAKQRRREQKKLVRELALARYQAIISDWRRYLDQEQSASRTKNSEPPIAELAGAIIRKRFQRVLREGQVIHAGSSDEDLHRLRIQGKKLRYCLEFFSSLYRQQEMKQLIKQLKMLQDNLGDFNDLSVQQEMLKEYLTAIRPGTVKSKKLSASIGGLLTNLYHEHNRVRTGFEHAFACFAAPENLELYRRLFG